MMNHAASLTPYPWHAGPALLEARWGEGAPCPPYLDGALWLVLQWALCLLWWAGVGVHHTVLPHGCYCPGHIPEAISSAGSVGAWAMLRLWKRGFSQVQAWCLALFASAKPVASPATET